MRPAGWKVVLAVGAGAVGVYFLVPRLVAQDPGLVAQDLVYLSIGAASTICVLWAIRVRRPAQRGAWYLLAAGSSCFVLGDGAQEIYEQVIHTSLPFPSWADALYIAGYPFLFVGVFRITRTRGSAGSWSARVDAAMVCVGALALLWQVMMGSYARDASLSGLGKLITMAYPVMDVGLLFIVIVSMMTGSRRRTAEQLLIVALALILVGDLVYDLMVLYGSYANGNVIDALFLLNYVFVAAAAFHPSVADPYPTFKKIRAQTFWWALIAGAAFVSPVILLISGVSGIQVDVGVLAGTTIVLLALAAVRTKWLFNGLARRTSQSEERGQALHQALATQQALENDLRHQAFHDSLSGLPNRALLHDRVQHALEASPRQSGTVVLLFCDLDGFKAVNDSFGHQFGDDLLVVVGKRLVSIVRPGDTVARLGGDEFAVLLENVDNVDAATVLAQRIVSVLREPTVIDDHQIQLSASVGVAFAVAGTTTETLLSAADAAMYDAKEHGKDRYTIFQSFMRSRVIDRLMLMNAFQGSLQRREFFLEYQPQHSLADGALEGFEALVRWQHPTLGRLEPIRFIPLAEETGFIIPLGRWILEQALAEAADWVAMDGRPLSISVNLSGRQLQERNLLQDVRTALSFSGVPPARLILEITETVLVVDPEDIAEVLQQFKDMGIRIAIDDFGSGYSSLSYLRQFPVDILKIDKSFIDPLEDPDSEGAAFVQTILGLAHDLRLQVTAEGIEKQIQRDTLTRMRCHSAQGYLLSRPLSARAAEAYIAGPVGVGASSQEDRDRSTVSMPSQ